MIRSNPFPLKQSELNEYFQYATRYLHENASRLRVTDKQLFMLKILLDEWNMAYSNYRESKNKNNAVYALSLAMDGMQNTLKTIYSQLNKLELTHLDQDTLHLHNFWQSQRLTNVV